MGKSVVLAVAAGLLGHAGFLPSTVSFLGLWSWSSASCVCVCARVSLTCSRVCHACVWTCCAEPLRCNYGLGTAEWRVGACCACLWTPWVEWTSVERVVTKSSAMVRRRVMFACASVQQCVRIVSGPCRVDRDAVAPMRVYTCAAWLAVCPAHEQGCCVSKPLVD